MGDCEVEVAEARRRWRYEMRGRDPDDPETAWADVFSALQRVHDMVRAELERAGLREDDCEAPVASLAEARMHRLGVEYMREIAVLEERAAEQGHLSGVGESAVVFSMKVARIGCQLDLPRSPDVWDWDVVPNLLLLEVVDRQVMGELEQCAEVAGVDLGTFGQVRASIMRYIGPLIEAVPPSARAIMDGFVEAGCAPSPLFCVGREGAE